MMMLLDQEDVPPIYQEPDVIEPGAAYPPATVPTTEAPTYKVTAYAQTGGLPWWAWLLIALGVYQLVKGK
jgi:hypothetical protein